MSFMNTLDDCIMRKYIVDGDLDGHVTGAWIPASGYRVAEFTAQWLGTSTPNGSFYFEGTNENPAEVTSPTAYAYYVDEAILTTATLTTGVISVNSGSAGNLAVSFEPVHPWVRFKYTRVGGGAVDTLQVQVTLKVA